VQEPADTSATHPHPKGGEGAVDARAPVRCAFRKLVGRNLLVVCSLIRYSAVMIRWLRIVLGTLRSAVRTHHELALGEPGAPAATCGVEGTRAAAAADRDRSDLLGSAVGRITPSISSRWISSQCLQQPFETVRGCDTDPQPASAGAFQRDGASDGGMDGAANARGVRAGGRAPVSDSGPRPSLWRTIFAPGQDVGHSGGRHCAPLAVAKRVCRAGDWLDSRRALTTSS